MGYTHYLYRPVKKDHDVEAWNKFVADCKYLYTHMPEHSESAGSSYADAPLMLNGCGGFNKPQFTSTRIYFNGTGSTKKRRKVSATNNKGKPYTYWVDDLIGVPQELQDLGHETLTLYRKAWTQQYEKSSPTLFSCCKTARKPYDLMVTACLILYKYYFPYVQIGSDGNGEDWQQAWEFVAYVLPKGPEIVTEMKLSNNLFEKLY